MGFLGVYGHVNVDHLLQVDALPGPETTVPVRSSRVRLGGTAANIARAAAFVGDDFPLEYRAVLEGGGLETTDLRRLPGSTPKVWIFTASGGSQCAVIDQGVMGDAVERPRLDYAWLNSTWVHFTTGRPEEWLVAAKDAREAGKKVAFDPAQELAYRYTSRTFESFLNLSDLFICNEHELPRALALLGYGAPQQLFDHAPRLLVTRGSQGATLLEERKSVEIPACPLRTPTATDPTGAGDVFRGGLYAALHRGLDWPEAVRVGSVASALFLERGGERFPSWDEVAARRREWSA